MSDLKISQIATVALPLRDWIHVIHAVESSYARKKKRGEGKKADEMFLIGTAIHRQLTDTAR